MSMCWSCWDADLCPYWLDAAPYVGLCQAEKRQLEAESDADENKASDSASSAS